MKIYFNKMKTTSGNVYVSIDGGKNYTEYTADQCKNGIELADDQDYSKVRVKGDNSVLTSLEVFSDITTGAPGSIQKEVTIPCVIGCNYTYSNFFTTERTYARFCINVLPNRNSIDYLSYNQSAFDSESYSFNGFAIKNEVMQSILEKLRKAGYDFNSPSSNERIMAHHHGFYIFGPGGENLFQENLSSTMQDFTFRPVCEEVTVKNAPKYDYIPWDNRGFFYQEFYLSTDIDYNSSTTLTLDKPFTDEQYLEIISIIIEELEKADLWVFLGGSDTFMKLNNVRLSFED